MAMTKAEMSIPKEMDDSPVSQAISYAWDGGDVWGSAMSEAYALCDFTTFHLGDRDEIPDSLGYQPAGMGNANASEGDGDPIYESLVLAFEAGDFTKADAFDYLKILDRFLDACKAFGLDY